MICANIFTRQSQPSAACWKIEAVQYQNGWVKPHFCSWPHSGSSYHYWPIWRYGPNLQRLNIVVTVLACQLLFCLCSRFLHAAVHRAEAWDNWGALTLDWTAIPRQEFLCVSNMVTRLNPLYGCSELWRDWTSLRKSPSWESPVVVCICRAPDVWLRMTGNN